MRVMALDCGTRRTGVAVCDEMGITVRPVETIGGRNRSEALHRAAELSKELGARQIVIGLPLNMDGSEGPAVRRVREFADGLRALVDVPIELCDERLTSREADQILLERGYTRDERKARSDEWAAVILLEDYLSRQDRLQNRT
ncbi:MAG TPA: Holliday junction resolvase RuvX [Blastocatellia bacterium]|nr:Holliday junction resolvase RuvX [Blastocatellia bacterium]